jgi:hypothetical protein
MKKSERKEFQATMARYEKRKAYRAKLKKQKRKKH